LALADKEQLQQARKDNQVLTRYIQARRKKEEAWKKEEEEEEEAQKKAEEEVWRKDMVVTRWSDEAQS
jgi:hypothetical protein